MSGTAFALLNDNNVAVGYGCCIPLSQCDAQKAATAAFGAQSATTGGENEFTDVDVRTKGHHRRRRETDALNNLSDVTAMQQSDNNFNNDNSNQRQRLMSSTTPSWLTSMWHPDSRSHPSNHINFTKNQTAEIEGSFNDATGVSNVNSAAGNMNNQTAFTTISIGSIGSTGDRH